MSKNHESLAFYRTLVENAREMITVIDEAGVITFQNPAVTIHLGYEPEEMVGRAAFDFVHPDDMEQAVIDLAEIEQRMEERKPSTLRFKRKDGTWAHVEVAGTDLEDGTLLVTREVSRQQATIAALRRSEEFFEAAFNATSAICTVTRPATGEFVEVNEAWTQKMGWTRDEAIGRTAMELGVWPSAAYRNELFAELTEKGSLKQRRAQLCAKSGERHTVLLDAEFIHVAEGQLVFLSAIDVTESEVLELQLRQSQKLESLGQLTGGIAHDFNNLLGVVMGNAELLSFNDSLDDNAKQAIATILRASENGANLIQQLLAFSRKQRLKPEKIRLTDRVRSLRPLLETTLGKDISLAFELEQDDGRCDIDIGQLESAILNLVINARDAMPEGGRVTVRLTTVNILANEAESLDLEPGDYYQLDVVDTGRGMSDDLIEHAFEPFFTTKDTSGGSGLGLSQVFGFTIQSGGHASIHRGDDGTGITVRLLLPRIGTPAEGADNSLATRVSQTPRQILLVEDNHEVRDMVHSLLVALGHRVDAFDSAETAFAHRGATPEILVTDVMLPGQRKGPEVAAEMRSRYPHIAVLYMSGFHQGGLSNEQLEAEDIHFIQKPFSRADFEAALESALERAPG